MAQRRMPGAKLIHRGQHAGFSQLVQIIGHLLKMVVQCAFADFNMQLLGGDSLLAQIVEQAGGKARLAQAYRRHIQGDGRQAQPLFAPLAQLRA